MDTQTLPMKLTRAITEAEKRDYERDGVIWLREIIDPEWAQEVARAAERVAADRPRSFVDFTNLGLAADASSAVSGSRGGELWTAPDLDWAAPKHLAGKVLLEEVAELALDARGHYLSIANCWTLDPFFEELALRSPIVEIAAVLMRTDRINLYEDQLLIKPPMTLEKTAWHHDLSYDNIEGMKMCGIRIPSHAAGNGSRTFPASRKWEPYVIGKDPTATTPSIKSISLSATYRQPMIPASNIRTLIHIRTNTTSCITSRNPVM